MDKVPPPKPRRTRQKLNTSLHYESLPTAPPAMCGRADENIFQFPAVASRARNLSASPKQCAEKDLPVCQHGKHSCYFCQPYRADRGTIEPLKNRLNSAIEAMDQLTRTYALLEGLLEQKLATITDNEEESAAEEVPESVAPISPTLAPASSQTPSTSTAPTPSVTSAPTPAAAAKADAEFELEHSLTWLESLFGTEVVPPIKQGKFKRIRERSKSMMEDEINMYLKGDRQLKMSSSRPYLLRRQSTYSDNKSKVSKWTKVKAAFKWERANVPPAGGQEPGTLMPLNMEVERYLKVPINTAGGSSSADSIISSSSGHFMSETGGTPGTISSASSMDELNQESGNRQAMRRNSSKSVTHTPNIEVELRKSATDERLDAVKAPTLPSKSASNKSLRRSKAFSDFEVLPEDHEADIKSTSSRRNKLPPSPLNLNHVCSDLPQLHSPLKSPGKDGNQLSMRMRHVSSPGNSSVPSSPSRHSDFFGEFESEDLSSGDFSEPTTPNRKSLLKIEDEVFQHYQLLLLKLDLEFKNKQSEFEQSGASNRSVKLCSGGPGSGSGKRSSEEHSPTQLLHSELMSTEKLEQNLTPQFKKKLHKWRAKQQSSNCYANSEPASSPTAKSQSGGELKPKIDWNLWSSGALKLEGQGLCALPDQKDLPEKFQKKLDQWNRLKCPPVGGTNSDNDSLKRSSKHNQSTRRGSDDDRWYKHKPHDKEKLARLKAIVAPDHTSKNIEVKTSDGEVMKFEGISRKFTRKLYEWEKARGIGPEASTFALLHPGYCPIDVRRINKECHKATAEHSPTLSRSLSLDSVAPSVNQAQVISQQASSLSLNDVNEFKELQDCADVTDHEFKKYDEPEAVMVEVEEHIHDTASPLVTAHTLVEQQTPIYKYEEVQCNDYVNSRRVQSFESHTNLAPLLGALKRADELFAQLRDASPDIVEHVAMRDCQTSLLSIRSIYPYYSNNLMKPSVLNAVSDVQSELGRLAELCLKSPLDEACCQETMQERNNEYTEELQGLHESLLCLKLAIQGGSNRYPRDIVPDINITAEDGQQLETSSSFATCDASSRDYLTLEEHSAASPSPSLMEHEHETETSTTTGTLCRASNVLVNANVNAAKKKLRLRKMGSRQNSKTESDSSDADTHSVLETPRRLRRKNFRLKQRSLDDDFRLSSYTPAASSAPIETDDIVCGSLKVKPGERIEETHSIASSLPQPVAQLSGFVPPPLPEPHTRSYNTNANVFVKTKRKLFTTVPEPTAAEGIVFIEKELESPTHSHEEAQSMLHTKLVATPRPLSLFKSISLERLAPLRPKEELRKCQSAEQLRRVSLQVRPPLASDSIKRLARSKRQLATASAATTTTPFPQVPPRRAHLYKKNSLHKSQSATVSNNIEHKIAKTSSGSTMSKVCPVSTSSSSLVLPNKLDNTLPRIQRKLEGKGKTLLTPTKPKQFEFPPPMLEAERPATPLTERALRLQQAKAQFLQSAPVTPRQEPTTPSSVMAINEAAASLHKSVSVGSMRGDTARSTDQLQQQEVTTDQESVSNSSAYDSLPRSVSRSGRISSKLGFATLASKLRRGGKKSKDPPPSSPAGPMGSALSALCRQTLFADVIALPQVSSGERPPPSPNSANSTRNVHKSQSSPQAAVTGGSTINLHDSYEGLNKSLSEQYVRQLKESDV
ncbi:uncharacterized protein LOC133839375 isoform X1 [Drosophila sulfurigaster albostrigata]|uniref:uncharacterized protein LOC133839375 isoform X1 n=1 Tax=Drosophila sulfurigaster albostrigata TaxID=89887 RepID=UPI002D21B1A0|nr:uncharacterized protein LOC133839375 isoform X1 [Drosophila sulfurigaster albostrigata]XP_062126863.1 uncharacterized protein LOC133839375 isoform X1 [Drosophila sulfurigaster albostrigata]XP_062126864.1 uncharacterized protein LOC133839375 isoform X1 [Drosophila sulfurigaster albostrigata]